MKKIILLSLVAAGMLFVGCGDKEKLETKEAVAGAVDKTVEAAAVGSTAVAKEADKAELKTEEVVMGAVDKTVEAAAVGSTAVANEVKKADTAVKDAVH